MKVFTTRICNGYKQLLIYLGKHTYRITFNIEHEKDPFSESEHDILYKFIKGKGFTKEENKKHGKFINWLYETDLIAKLEK